MTDETTLTVWVPITPVNASNAREGWRAKAARIQREREATATAVWAALHEPVPQRWRWTITAKASDPKVVTFTVHTPRAFDDDALPGICKSVRDELVTLGLLDGDAPRHGHTFTYAQAPDTRRGLTLTVTRKQYGGGGHPGAAGYVEPRP